MSLKKYANEYLMPCIFLATASNKAFFAKIGLVVQSFCIMFDVAHTKYNYNRIKVMLQLEMDRID